MVRELDFVDECYADKDLSLLKKLTLVIPTYNRNYYLSRCLWYHAHFPFGQIIVADSSPEEKKVVNRETVAKVREIFGADILYLEYEPETEKYGGDIYRKWGDAVMHVETEYSQICGDKEYIIPSTLNSEIEFLDNNLEYVSAVDKKYLLLQNSKRKGQINILKQKHIERASQDLEMPLERVKNALYSQPYHNSLLLTLLRTEVMKKVYLGYLESDINDIRYGEIFLGYAPYVYGKTLYLNKQIHKIRDITKLVRDGNVRSRVFSSESSTSRYPHIFEYNKHPECLSFHGTYANHFTKLIVNKSGDKWDVVKPIIENRNIPIYVGYGNSAFVRKMSDIGAKYLLDSYIWNLLPNQIVRIFHEIVQHLFKLSIPQGRDNCLEIGQLPEAELVNYIITNPQVINNKMNMDSGVD